MRVAAACTASDRVPCSSSSQKDFSCIHFSSGDDVRPRELPRSRRRVAPFLVERRNFQIRATASRNTRSLNYVPTEREKLADVNRVEKALSQWRNVFR